MRDLAMCGRLPDVMRGEEAKIVGAPDTLGGSGLVCLPGTQAKWVRLQGRRIAGFTTHMTGEVFGALRDDTILGYLMWDAPLDTAAFDCGVTRSAPSVRPGSRHIFLTEARWSRRRRVATHTNPHTRPSSMTGRRSGLRSTIYLPTRAECAIGSLPITTLTPVTWRMRR
jgi:2-keto-3-deoxy-galactonokinase